MEALLIIASLALAIVLAVRAHARAGNAERQVEALRKKVDRLLSEAPPVGAPPARKATTFQSRSLPTAVIPPTPVEVPPPPPSGPPSAPPAPEPTPGVAPVPTPAPTLEETIGLYWFTRVGAVIGILVAGWFFKYMVDNDWIGPWGRVGIGTLVGVALLAWGEHLARRGEAVHPYFARGILGLGLSLLLVSAFASFAYYGLMRLEVTFGIVAALCVLGGVLAHRHRAEAILAISLIAVFLNPILLSTGEDRSLVLFGYLLIMTGGAFLVSVRLEFRVTPWFAVATAAILWSAWSDRFFAPGLDGGPYAEVSARAIPLAFAALFPALWAGSGVAMRRRGSGDRGLTFLILGILAAHAAFTGLLFDEPVALGVVLVLLGLGAATLLIREGRADLMALPVIAAFGALAVTTPAVNDRGPTGALIVAGLLAAVHHGAVLLDASRRDVLRSGGALARLGLSGFGFAVLGAAWLLPERFLVFAAILTALAAFYLLLGMLLGRDEAGPFTLVAGLIGLLGASACAEVAEPVLLVAIGVWMLLHLAIPAFEALARGAAWSSARLVTLGGAAPGFVALLLVATPPEAERLRGALIVGAAAAYLAPGLRMRRDGEKNEDRSLLPLGLGVALIALATGILLRGPGLTVAWAVEGAVLAFVASRTDRRGRVGHPFWLTAALVVLGLGALRLLSVDATRIKLDRTLFLETLGASGSLQPGAFGHPLAWSLLGMGVALLVAARCISRIRREGSSFPEAAVTLLILGHGALLWLVIGEARLLFTEAPTAVPTGLSEVPFTTRVQAFDAAIRGQAARLGMVTTVALGVYAGALLGLGFAAWSRTHRLLGIGLFGIAIAKLGLWDIWALQTLQKIAVGGSIAALLLAGGFLYARFGDRIRTLLMETPDRGDEPTEPRPGDP